MEAARIRQQILSGEQDIDALNGNIEQSHPQPQMQMQMQMPMNGQFQQQPRYSTNNYSNYDVMTPVGGSRKASLTSQSNINRFFKRKGGGGGGGDFDDNDGADIGDLTNNFAFDELSHIRDRGPYGLSGTKTLDTTPFIPTIGAQSGRAPTNNIQYRKQLNHQKKMELANGARAMSLAGSNPMQQDPRSMSMTGPRTMSLMSSPNPHTMSLNRPGMVPQMSNGNVPRAMSMRLGMAVPPQNRAMSLTNSNPMMNNQMMMNQNMQYNQMNPQMMNNQMMNNQMMNPQMNGQMNPQMNPQMMNNHMNPQMMNMNGQMNPQMNMNRLSNGQVQNRQYPYGQRNSNSNMYAPPQAQQSQQNSNDSLMNVLEESEEEAEGEKKSGPRRIPPSSPEKPISSSSPLRGAEEDDVVYKFEDDTLESPSMSRKSTLKKSNSMRLRKLDLFSESGSPQRTNLHEQETSPSFNLKNTSNLRESMVNDDDVDLNEDHESKLKSLGATATMNSSNGTNIYLTASDFNTPSKSPRKPVEEEGDSDYDTTLKGRGSPIKVQANPMSNKPRIKSLTTNTAFSQFRTASDYSLHSDNDDPSSRGSNYNSHQSSDKSDITIARENMGTPPTTNTSNEHSIEKTIPEDINEKSTPDVSVSRNDTIDSKTSTLSKKDSKNRRSFSLSGKSKNLLKRLSKGKRSSVANDDFLGDESLDDVPSSPSMRRRLSSNASFGFVPENKPPPVPLKFSKEELAIMTSNNDLLNELQSVTAELAASIKRELALEKRLKNHPSPTTPVSDLEHELLEKLKKVNELQEKLNNERRLRFISEEHAILSEHGQSPSPLKLSYEKNEICKQLLAKNELAIQLQDRLDELQANPNFTKEGDETLLDKYQELVKENTELKFTIIPNMEKEMKSLSLERPSASRTTSNRQLSLVTNENSDVQTLSSRTSATDQDDQYMEIMALKNQREELREVITKLTSSHQYEAKLASDKIRNLEQKVRDIKKINDKLSKRVDDDHQNGNGNGGRLGLTIVDPTKKFFD